MLSLKQRREYQKLCERISLPKLEAEVQNNQFMMQCTYGEMNAASYQYLQISQKVLDERLKMEGAIVSAKR